MPEPMIRGHVIIHTASFLRTQSDHSRSQAIESELSAPVRSALEHLAPAKWYPRQFQVELLNALAAVRGHGDATYGELMRCGAGMVAVDNEFFRLLMKVLTPELFIKKLAKFWQRDHRHSGSFELKSLEGGGVGGRLQMRDVAGYDHAAILWLGWLKRMLEVISGRHSEVRQSGWSWSNPAPSEIIYEVKWA